MFLRILWRSFLYIYFFFTSWQNLTPQCGNKQDSQLPYFATKASDLQRASLLCII